MKKTIHVMMILLLLTASRLIAAPGGPLSGVEIKLIHDESGKVFKGKTDVNGNHRFSNLLAGNYIIHVPRKTVENSSINESMSPMGDKFAFAGNPILDEYDISGLNSYYDGNNSSIACNHGYNCVLTLDLNNKKLIEKTVQEGDVCSDTYFCYQVTVEPVLDEDNQTISVHLQRIDNK